MSGITEENRWDMDHGKHCARYYGWLPASKEYQVGKKNLKYFTLCAEQAIDVFMLESEGVLSRDQKGDLPNVVICEGDELAVPKILKLVRPPSKRALITGKLQEILTFQDTAKTEGRSYDDEDRIVDPTIRKLLRDKKLLQQLKGHFPFDIINFDTFGNLLNPDKKVNRLLYQSFEKIFELQKAADSFLLFVTIPITHIHADIHTQFTEDLKLNANEHSKIREALLSRVETISYDEIDENIRTAIGFAKSVVLSAAGKEGWNGEHKGIHIYHSNNESRRKMLSSVVQFSKAQTIPDQSIYVADVVRVIEEMPKYYSYDESGKNQKIKKHLDGVIKYRERIRKKYRD